jgi:hypothetical protein
MLGSMLVGYLAFIGSNEAQIVPGHLGEVAVCCTMQEASMEDSSDGVESISRCCPVLGICCNRHSA